MNTKRANYRFCVGHNFPGNRPGEYSEIVDADNLAEAKLCAAKCLYDSYTPYCECEVFAGLAKWLASAEDNFEFKCGAFIFYIEPAAY